MDAEQLEKEFSFWSRLLYVALGSSVTLLVSSVDQLRGLVWLVLQVVVTTSGFYLLWGKRWRALPLSRERTNTIFGYLLASWLLSLVPGFLGADSLYYIIVFGYAIFLLVTYKRTQKVLAVSEEMFP